ncbi:MAG: hypothetical protein MJZ53_06340 [Paludibacteraceae bacterium]|nr:hypothetical protein [Paludibacteraceae bacterium]
MTHFNLIKSLTKKVVNNNRLLILCLSLAVYGVGEVPAANYKATVSASASPSGKGSVYVNTSNSKGSSSSVENSGNKNGEYTNYLYAEQSTGYTFSKWTSAGVTNKGTLTINNATTQNGASVYVKLGGKKNETFSVQGNFTANTYTVAFNGNGASDGSTAAQGFTYDAAQSLKANGFKKEYIVTLNADGGTADVNTLTSSAPFLGWATSENGNVVYSNQQSVSNLSSAQGATVNLYAKWGDYPSVTLPVATRPGKVLVGWKDDKTTRLAGETYTPTGNITMTAIWMDSYPFTMSCNVNSLKVEEENSSAFTFTYADNPTPHIADASIIAYNKESHTLIGLKEGTTTIYFTQAATSTIQAGTSDTYTITVSKIANTLTADATHPMKVDETWTSVISGKNSDATVTTTSSDETVAYYDVTNDKIVAQNTGNQSFNSKVVTITISQAATYKYTAASKTITVTVNKWDNHISINGSQDSYQTSIYVDAQQAISLTATNIDYSGSPITATQTAGNTIATLNAAQTQVSSNSKLGTATWSLSQPENYKYKAASATMTISVVKAPEATNCYVLNDANERSWSTISNSGNYGPFDAAGITLHFEAKRTAILGVTNTTKFYAQYSTDGSNWTNCLTINLDDKDKWYPLSCSIPETAKYVRFETETGATGSKQIRNVRVTRKTYLTANDLTIDKTTANEVIYPNEQGQGTITVNRSLASGGNLKVAWDSDKFTINGKTAAQGLDLGDFGCATGTSPLNVVFSSNVAGTFSTPVRIYNNVYNTTITLTGTTHERETSPFANQETSVDVSLNDQDKVTLDLTPLTDDYVGNGEITYTVISGEETNLSGSTFYATQVGTCQVKATAAQTNKYNGAEKIITIHVVKRTPTISWKSFEHIYSGQILEDVASTSYNGNPVALALTYTHVAGSFAVDGNKLRIDNQFTEAHNATVRVTTTETDFYAQTSEEHTYYLESKALPKFFLNGVEMSTETENELVLKVGETATVTFDQIVESELTYTQNAQFVSYDHQTGVITGLAFGNEGFQFHQSGTATVFDRLCQMHIWVEKHEVTLSSPINNNDIWLVDSIYAGNMYTINDDGYTGHAQESVTVESDNEAVIRHQQDGSWKAVGEGTATLTMRQINNGYWTGDTITRTIKVQKHTPVITWNIENAQYPWSSVISAPVTSSNTDISFTLTSSNKSVADYVDGHIVVYNTTGSVTFTFAQEGNYKWNAATTNLTKSFTTFQPANHVPFTLNNSNNTNFYSTHSGTYTWSNGYKIGDGGINTLKKNTSSVTIHFTGVPDKLSFTKTLSKDIIFQQLPGDGDCNCYVYESADGSSWSQCWKDVERVETKNVSDIQLQPTTRYLKFEYKESCLYCNYSSINVTERSSIEPVASSLDFGTGYNGNTAAKRTVDVNWYSVMPCTVAISGADVSQFYLADDSKTISSMLDNSGSTTLSVFYTHEENKSHSATLTITSGDTPAKTATIQLSGKTERAPQEIIWREDITPLPHDGGVYEGAALASSGGEVVLTSDDENVVKVVDGGLQPIGVGTTTVHAYQAGDDIKWQPVNAEKVIEVTSLSVQHLIWDDQLNNIKRSEGNNVNITLTAQSDAIAQDPTLVVTYELDEAAKTFATVSGNQLTITGWGAGYITAKQVGNANYIATQKVKPIISRNPDADCKMLAGEYWEEYTLHTIASKEIAITNGEPATIEFDAKMSAVAVGEGMHLDEWYNDSWHEFKYIDWADMHSDYNHYGPYNLNRQSTEVRLYTNTGATMTRTFKNVEITLARYLELAQNDMSFAGVDKGAFLDQTFYINYSNLRGTLDVELKNTSSNLQVMTTTVGEECGEIGKMIPVTIRCIGNVCGTENNVIVLSNKEQQLEVPITATVVPPSQNITWNPQTDILTTDVVALNATCTSNLPISYSSNNTDVATVQQDGEGSWSMTIIKDGEVTITASQAGSTDWSPAPDKNITFHISKADPVVSSWGTPSEVIKWSTLSTSIITGGETSVSGTFTWQDGTISVERGNSGYIMVFTPTNTNWYNTVTNTIVVPVAKDPQTITWNYTPAPIFCNAQLTFDATASSGLKVRYETSDANIAYVNDNKLYIISGGNVTITAVQDGNDTWAYASLSKDIEILRWTPTVVTLPTANTMLIGQHLDNATLYGGVAEVDNQKVDGSFAWKDGSTTTINVAGMATKTVVFTPSNPNHFNPTTCEVMVEVKKYAPAITHNLIGTAITYGQSLSESVLSGTLTAMDNVKYPSVEVAGSYAWKEPTKKLEAGNHIALVHFTPTNLDWYEEIDVEVPIVVNKAHATSATAIVNMLYGQILDEVQPINTTADALTGIVEGTITWDATVDVNDMPSQGEYDYPIHLAVNDPNYVAETIDGICHVTVEKGFVFDGHGGSTEWNSTDNWVDGTQPTTMEDKVIVIADAIIINSEVNVGAITIKQGVDVTIDEDGVLNVGDYDGVSRKEYGNMIIKRGGQLNLNEGEVQVNNFTLEAALGGTVNESRVAARSGRVDNIESLVVNGDAYFDIALDVNGVCSPGWYDLTVPFPVNATTGVQRFENSVLRTNLKCETNYAIMAYHEDVRAEGKYGWAKYHGVMQPGQCYSITIDDVHNIYRFVKAKGTALNAENTIDMTSTAGAGGDAHQGWNGLGNGTLTYATLAAAGIDKVQIYDHTTNSYAPVTMSDKIFAVGSAFFVQTPTAQSMVYNKTNEESVFAPRREGRSIDEFLVTLSKQEKVQDQLYLSASEDAVNAYEIGHDLSKFDVSNTIAQMWCSAYNMKLCDVELPLESDNAIFPLTITTPKAGEYTIAVTQAPHDAQLFLLHNGTMVAELTMGNYALELNKGTYTDYQLQLVAGHQITTDCEDVSAENNVRKVIFNNKLYIIRDNAIYTATGNKVK